jgi:hypothetical protein
MKQSRARGVFVTGWGVGLGLVCFLAGIDARAEPVDGKKTDAKKIAGKKIAYVDPNVPENPHSGDLSLTIAAPKREAVKGDDGPLDPIRLGAFTGVGFPRPISVEGFIKIEKIIGFGVEYSLMPDLTIGGINAQFNAIMGDIRVFPLENGFFIGIGAGHQHLSAVSATALPSQLGGGTPGVTVDTYILNPRIGYLSTWSWGMTLGIDVGLQIPLGATTTNTIPAGASPDPSGIANVFGKTVLPTVDLLRIGLLI